MRLQTAALHIAGTAYGLHIGAMRQCAKRGCNFEGNWMKALVVYSYGKEGDRAADLLARGGDVKVEKSAADEDYRNLVERVRSKRGGFDIAIVITKEAIASCADLNKVDGLRAAVCDGADEFREAASAGVNVIVAREGVGKGLFKEISASAGAVPQKKAANAQKRLADDIKAPTKKAEPKAQPKQESAPARKQGGNGNFFGKLKDSLGLDE